MSDRKLEQVTFLPIVISSWHLHSFVMFSFIHRVNPDYSQRKTQSTHPPLKATCKVYLRSISTTMRKALQSKIIDSSVAVLKSCQLSKTKMRRPQSPSRMMWKWSPQHKVTFLTGIKHTKEQNSTLLFFFCLLHDICETVHENQSTIDIMLKTYQKHSASKSISAFTFH